MKLAHIVLIGITLLGAQGLQGAAAQPKFYHQIIDADDAQGLAHWLDERGVDVNTLQYMTKPLLIAAAEEGRMNIVEFLIMYGADVNIVDGDSNVWFAAAGADRNSEQLIRLLQQQKVPGINAPGGWGAGMTPLINAVRENPAVVPLLLEYGADPTIKDLNNATALDYAHAFKRDKIIIHLLSEAMQRKTEEKKKCR